jgi:seryl-tRNA(Sec) selenium transferase
MLYSVCKTCSSHVVVCSYVFEDLAPTETAVTDYILVVADLAACRILHYLFARFDVRRIKRAGVFLVILSRQKFLQYII